MSFATDLISENGEKYLQSVNCRSLLWPSTIDGSFLSTIKGLGSSRSDETISWELEKLRQRQYTAPTNKAGSLRRYHTFSHIADCLLGLEVFSSMRDDISYEDNDDIFLALLYHDCVYITDDPTVISEVESACYAMRSLSWLGVPYKRISRICELILATHHAHPNTAGPAGDLIRSIDLQGFSADAHIFAQTSGAVEAEYRHLDHKTFVKGRIAFMEGLLAKGVVFEHEFYREMFENRAMSNIRRHIEDLKAEL